MIKLALFAHDEGGRQTHLAGPIAQALTAKGPELFASPLARGADGSRSEPVARFYRTVCGEQLRSQ